MVMTIDAAMRLSTLTPPRAASGPLLARRADRMGGGYSWRASHLNSANPEVYGAHARAVETLKALDAYVMDHRLGSAEAADPLFTDRHGKPLTGNAVRKLFERLKTRTGIRDLCAHMLRHT